MKPFPPPEARRLVERFEWRYMPKYGSWLNLAESEGGVLASQCLDSRIPNKPTIAEEVAASVENRNAHRLTLHNRACLHQIEKLLPLNRNEPRH